MVKEIETAVEAYERGAINRRQLIAGLGAVVAMAMHGSRTASADGSTSTFRSVGLNHIALRVPDVAKARDFYVEHLGCRVLRDGERNCFLGCGANNFIALFRSDTAKVDHYCFTVEGFDPSTAVETLRSAGIEPERHDDRVYFDDLNGITVQLASEWGDYPGGRPT
jgi:catechol 2,3-dioxygenase-like lactoylglutathione lyase family enzyme